MGRQFLFVATGRKREKMKNEEFTDHRDYFIISTKAKETEDENS